MSNLDMIFLLIILALVVVRHSTTNDDVAQSEYVVYQSCDTKYRSAPTPRNFAVG